MIDKPTFPNRQLNALIIIWPHEGLLLLLTATTDEGKTA